MNYTIAKLHNIVCHAALLSEENEDKNRLKTTKLHYDNQNIFKWCILE